MKDTNNYDTRIQLIYEYFFMNDDLTPSESIDIELVDNVFVIETTFIDDDELREATYKIELSEMKNITKWKQVKELI